MKKAKTTQQIVTNKNLSIDFSAWKQNITKFRYGYFDFDKAKVAGIAEIDVNDLTISNARILIQALFPQYLVCSGLIDTFILFEVKNGVRIDPPKYWYYDLSSFLNNDEETKVNRLLDEIKDLFEKNEIKYSESWQKVFNSEVR